MSETPPRGSFNVSEPPWDEILVRKSNREAVKYKLEPWLHCLALGIWLPHSVPEFPRVYKTNPSDHLLSTPLCAKCFYSQLLPQLAVRRLEVTSSPPFYRQITEAW